MGGGRRNGQVRPIFGFLFHPMLKQFIIIASFAAYLWHLKKKNATNEGFNGILKQTIVKDLNLYWTASMTDHSESDSDRKLYLKDQFDISLHRKKFIIHFTKNNLFDILRK